VKDLRRIPHASSGRVGFAEADRVQSREDAQARGVKAAGRGEGAERAAKDAEGGQHGTTSATPGRPERNATGSGPGPRRRNGGLSRYAPAPRASATRARQTALHVFSGYGITSRSTMTTGRPAFASRRSAVVIYRRLFWCQHPNAVLSAGNARSQARDEGPRETAGSERGRGGPAGRQVRITNGAADRRRWPQPPRPVVRNTGQPGGAAPSRRRATWARGSVIAGCACHGPARTSSVHPRQRRRGRPQGTDPRGERRGSRHTLSTAHPRSQGRQSIGPAAATQPDLRRAQGVHPAGGCPKRTTIRRSRGQPARRQGGGLSGWPPGMGGHRSRCGCTGGCRPEMISRQDNAHDDSPRCASPRAPYCADVVQRPSRINSSGWLAGPRPRPGVGAAGGAHRRWQPPDA